MSRVSPELIVAGLVWLLSVSFGMAALVHYGQKPGEMGEPPEQWPNDTSLPSLGAKPRLVMLVHPKCPCSRASLAELERLVARVPGGVDGHVLFYEPEDIGAAWRETDLWQTAARIPGLTLTEDPNGDEAKRFGALTSGWALVYAPDGALVFAGGLTPSRGHEGDNQGKAAVIKALTGTTPMVNRHAVYGCAMADPEACMKDEGTL